MTHNADRIAQATMAIMVSLIVLGVAAFIFLALGYVSFDHLA